MAKTDKEETPLADDPVFLYRSIVNEFMPLVMKLVQAVIELEMVLTERRRRRIQGLDSIPSRDACSPPDEEDEGGESESLVSDSPPFASTPLPVPSPEIGGNPPAPASAHDRIDEPEGEDLADGEGSKKRQQPDNADSDAGREEKRCRNST